MSLSIDGVWKSGIWAPTVWADGVWREGAAPEEEVVVGLAAVSMPIDFVISPPYYMHEIQTYRNSLGLAHTQHTEFADADEEREMRQLVAAREVIEMIQLYATYAQ